MFFFNSPVKEQVASASEPVEEQVEKNKKRHLNVVFIGHVGAGKTVIGIEILYLTGPAPNNWHTGIIEYLTQHYCKANTFPYRFLRVIKDIPQGKFKGRNVGHPHFETETTRFALLDAPGHKLEVFVMIAGAYLADIGVLVISARQGEFETGFEKDGQTREHVRLVKGFGVSKLLVLVNKMDDPIVNWSKERYDEIVAKMVPFLKSSGYNVNIDIQFLPISGIQSANIETRVDKSVCSWFDGQCLFEALDAIDVPPRDPIGPFRMPIVSTDILKGPKTVVGKVESGSVCEGDNLLLMPNQIQVQVLQVRVQHVALGSDDTVQSAGPGEILKVKIDSPWIDVEDMEPGFVLSSIENRIPVVHEFEAQLHIFGIPDNTIFSAGYKALLYAHAAVKHCEIIKLMRQIDPETRQPMRKRVIFVKNGDIVICRIQVTNVICVEKFSDFQKLSQFALRYQGKTIATGEVRDL